MSASQVLQQPMVASRVTELNQGCTFAHHWKLDLTRRLFVCADFGLSIDCLAERPVTRVGTLDYMAPEVRHCGEGGSSLASGATAGFGGTKAGFRVLPANIWLVTLHLGSTQTRSLVMRRLVDWWCWH